MKFCHWNGLQNGLQAKYTITCFSVIGQRMRTNIVAIATRPSFSIDGLGTRLAFRMQGVVPLGLVDRCSRQSRR